VIVRPETVVSWHSEGLSPLLGMDFQEEAHRSPTSQPRDYSFDPKDGDG